MPLLDKVCLILVCFMRLLSDYHVCLSLYSLWQILAERATLYDYELIVGDNGKRLLAFGNFAGRAGMVDFMHGLGQRMCLLLFNLLLL